jgi:hypothetical protein
MIKDEEIVLSYGKEGKEEHRSRCIAYWEKVVLSVIYSEK